MDTKGFFGFILHGIRYLIYVENNADNLYDELAEEICIIIHYYRNIEEVKNAFQKLKIVTENDTPSDEDIENTQYFHKLTISDRSSWHCLLSKCQGSFIKVLESGYLLHSNEKYLYGYIFIWNLDEDTIQYNSFDVSTREEIGFSLKSIYILLKEKSSVKINYEDIVNKIKTDYEIRNN